MSNEQIIQCVSNGFMTNLKQWKSHGHFYLLCQLASDKFIICKVYFWKVCNFFIVQIWLFLVRTWSWVIIYFSKDQVVTCYAWMHMKLIWHIRVQHAIQLFIYSFFQSGKKYLIHPFYLSCNSFPVFHILIIFEPP